MHTCHRGKPMPNIPTTNFRAITKADLNWCQLSLCQRLQACLSCVLNPSKWDKWRQAGSNEQTKRVEMSRCALLSWNTHCPHLVIREKWASGNQENRCCKKTTTTTTTPWQVRSRVFRNVYVYNWLWKDAWISSWNASLLHRSVCLWGAKRSGEFSPGHQHCIH